MDSLGYGIRVPGLVISPYARRGFIDPQTLSSDAYLKFIEDDFLGGAAARPGHRRPPGRAPRRPGECSPSSATWCNDFNFSPDPAAAADPEAVPGEPTLIPKPKPGCGGSVSLQRQYLGDKLINPPRLAIGQSRRVAELALPGLRSPGRGRWGPCPCLPHGRPRRR